MKKALPAVIGNLIDLHGILEFELIKAEKREDSKGEHLLKAAKYSIPIIIMALEYVEGLKEE